MSTPPCPWLTDFSSLPPLTRRLAHYTLRLCLAHPRILDQGGFFTSHGYLIQLLGPLCDPQGLKHWRPAAGDDDQAPGGPDAVSNHDPGVPLTEDALGQWLQDGVRRMPREVLQCLTLQDGQEPVNPVIPVLGQALGLSDLEMQVLDYLDCHQRSAPFRDHLDRLPQASARENRERLSQLLNVDVPGLTHALSPQASLRRLNLVQYAKSSDLEDFIQGSDLLGNLLDESGLVDAHDLLARLVEPAPAAAWPLSDFPHLAAVSAAVGTALGQAARHGELGVNALLYGPPGTGKTELARALAAAQGLRAYQVRSADAEGEGLEREGRLSAYLLAQRLLTRQRQVCLIFDEVEDVFHPRNELHALLQGEPTGQQKGWMNRILEENAVPAIWITNRTEGLDPAFLRRFLLPVACGTPPRSVRRQMAERHLGEAGVPPALLDELAADAALRPAALGAARRLVGLRPDASPEQAVREGVAAIRTLLHGAPAPWQRPMTTAFDVAFLNLAGDLSPSAIVRALDRRGRGSLCFYGPPGTGKTAFAEVLAEALDRELVVRPASDLISPFVGETEQNLARLFREADPRHTVLLLDEVDSFLADRSQARQQWERTQLNELLQQMERYPGIFIAATNRMSGLDAAAMRRFDFKLHFRALNPAQRRALFAREALGDAEAPLPPEVERHLASLEGLAPGDFATVCRQQALLGERLSPQRFLRRLAGECRFKQKVGATG
jgi:transitional endoplasmic reticulum ATPase